MGYFREGVVNITKEEQIEIDKQESKEVGDGAVHVEDSSSQEAHRGDDDDDEVYDYVQITEH